MSITNENVLKKYKMLQIAGSCKIVRRCTAHMSVAIDSIANNGVTVSYCSHHIGHEMQLSHLRLSTETRLEVANLLQQGFTVSEIIDRMRQNADNSYPRDQMIRRLVVFMLTSYHEKNSWYFLTKLWHIDTKSLFFHMPPSEQFHLATEKWPINFCGVGGMSENFDSRYLLAPFRFRVAVWSVWWLSLSAETFKRWLSSFDKFRSEGVETLSLTCLTPLALCDRLTYSLFIQN